MTKHTRRRFSPEYKEQSVARLSQPGATHSSVAAELGVTPTQLKTWVFPSPLNSARPRTELDLWERLRKLAGLEGVRIHDLRHTCASSPYFLAAKELINHGNTVCFVQFLEPPQHHPL